MATQIELPSAKEMQLRPHTPMDLLQLALHKEAAIDVIERLMALQREEREYQARVAFDDALSRCQSKLERVSADANNEQTRSRYATYAKLDKTVRPIYTAEGFSVSFGEKDCPTPGKTRFVAYLSRGGITREYIKDMTPSTKGPQGKDFMTPIHADATADSYAKRYLVKDIFNIAIGDDDTDGNTSSGPEFPGLGEYCTAIHDAATFDEMDKLFREAYSKASTIKSTSAKEALGKAREEWRKRKGGK